jgi:hypothetical protein
MPFSVRDATRTSLNAQLGTAHTNLTHLKNAHYPNGADEALTETPPMILPLGVAGIRANLI